MAFDKGKWAAQTLVPRTAEVAIPECERYFGQDERPVFLVRGLTGEELARVRSAGEVDKRLEEWMKGVVASGRVTRIATFRELLGLGESVPEDLAMRYQMLAEGSVEPDFNHTEAVKFFHDFPHTALLLTKKISDLSGLGGVPGKPKGSTVKAA